MAETSTTSRVGFALVGAGMIAPTHVKALSALRSKINLTAIISQRPERAMHLAEHYEGAAPAFTNDISVVIDNPEVQAVIVATPANVRIELIEALAQAGKHILLEKPVARTAEEALQVVEMCEQAGVKLGVVFQHRMRETSKAAAQLVGSGELGSLGHVEIAVPLWRDQSYYDELERGTYERDGGGVLITQAIHTIDLALSLTGPVVSVQAMTATTPLHTMESEDLAVVGLRFASGAVGSLVASTAVFPHRRETITLHFDKASLHLGPESMDVSWRDGRSDRVATNMGSAGEEGPVIAKYEWHQAVIETFLEAIQNGADPIVSGREALASHRLIEAIETSSRTGNVVNMRD